MPEQPDPVVTGRSSSFAGATLGSSSPPPFDARRLDTLMDDAGIDVLVATSKHNIQYLLGGYRYFFYSAMDAHGLNRYLPFFIYFKGSPAASAYIGSPMERYEQDLGKFWVERTHFKNMTAAQSAASAAEQIKHHVRGATRIGIEMSFLPIEAFNVLRSAFPGAEFVNSTFTLELLRAVKTPFELQHIRAASDKVADAMLAVFSGLREGMTKTAIVRALEQEETGRGLNFDYCLINMGAVFNRAPSDQAWRKGEVLALDSGGNASGYIGDLTRMAVLGEPDAELIDLLAEIDEIQQAARRPIRAGTRGGDVYVEPDSLVERSAFRDKLEFVAHGMGLVSHEAPWLTDRCSVPYPAYHADRPLEAGMVLSIETTLQHPARGFIKLEDTVVVTETGWEAYGDHGRGWNRPSGG
jgi:Xaa-Pro aminopeptidase